MTRQDLENLRFLDEQIKRKLERIDYLRMKMLPSAIQYKADKSATATVFDPIGDIYAEIDIEDRKVDKLIDRYYDERQAAINTINKLKDRRKRNILYYRYIEFMSWQEVEKQVNKRDKCSIQTIYRLHNQALEKIK